MTPAFLISVRPEAFRQPGIFVITAHIAIAARHAGTAAGAGARLSGWLSHTHPQPSQSKHFMVAARTAYIDDARGRILHHPATVAQ
jgi:hypothetical protein